MKNWKIITLATLAVVAAALLVSTVAAMGPFAYNPNTGYGGMMGRGGMMGGYGYGYGSNSPPYTAQPSTTPSTQYYQPVYPSMFGGMMGRMFNGFGGMMRSYGYGAPYTYTGTTLSIADASTIAQKYVTSIGNTNLEVKQVKNTQTTSTSKLTTKQLATGHSNC